MANTSKKTTESDVRQAQLEARKAKAEAVKAKAQAARQRAKAASVNQVGGFINFIREKGVVGLAVQVGLPVDLTGREVKLDHRLSVGRQVGREVVAVPRLQLARAQAHRHELPGILLLSYPDDDLSAATTV